MKHRTRGRFRKWLHAILTPQPMTEPRSTHHIEVDVFTPKVPQEYILSACYDPRRVNRNRSRSSG
jgi:hypothetical protein